MSERSIRRTYLISQSKFHTISSHKTGGLSTFNRLRANPPISGDGIHKQFPHRVNVMLDGIERFFREFA
nr:Uncharacterised protein [Raoultella sp. NCTC 9187]